jgi:hypothetical protein
MHLNIQQLKCHCSKRLVFLVFKGHFIFPVEGLLRSLKLWYLHKKYSKGFKWGGGCNINSDFLTDVCPIKRLLKKIMSHLPFLKISYLPFKWLLKWYKWQSQIYGTLSLHYIVPVPMSMLLIHCIYE